MQVDVYLFVLETVILCESDLFDYHTLTDQMISVIIKMDYLFA